MDIRSIDIEFWIKERFPIDCNWTSGNCYFFAIILEAAFPGGKIIYDPIIGHFLYQYKNKCYDYTGEVSEPTVWYDWDTYDEEDFSHWQHVMRDCVGGFWNGILEQEEEN